MRDGRINRAIKHGRTRTSELTDRVPDLRERVPELRDRVQDLNAELRERVPELKGRADELRARGTDLARQYAKMDVSWARSGLARALRGGILTFVLGPMIDFYTRRRIFGREVFRELESPVIFVANHSSHLDTPTILRAIPRKWRSRTAVAAAADYFYNSRFKAWGVALLFNTVPIGRSGGGLGGGATDHVDRLIDQRWNLLIFPEGTRSRDGSVGKVRSGAAVIAAQHGIDVVPIFVNGTHTAMPPGQNWPQRLPGRLFSRRHRIEVHFGEPIAPRNTEQRREVMDQVRAYWEAEAGTDETAGQLVEHDVLLMHRALREHEAREAAARVVHRSQGERASN